MRGTKSTHVIYLDLKGNMGNIHIKEIDMAVKGDNNIFSIQFVLYVS